MSAKTFENKTEKADEFQFWMCWEHAVLLGRSSSSFVNDLFPNKTSQKEASSSEEAVNTR